MNAAEHTAIVNAAKKKFDLETVPLRARLELARLEMSRAEEMLRKAQESLDAEIHAATRRFVGLDVDAIPAPTPPVQREPITVAVPPHDPESASKRGAMDEPLLAIARSLPQPVSAPQVWEAWNAAHPDDPTTRSTARGVLERHVKTGRMEIANAGGRGSFNPKTYRVKEE